jgi:hypothetical protein
MSQYANTCNTCRHVDTLPDRDPCFTCGLGLDEGLGASHWTPKRHLRALPDEDLSQLLSAKITGALTEWMAKHGTTEGFEPYLVARLGLR